MEEYSTMVSSGRAGTLLLLLSRLSFISILSAFASSCQSVPIAEG